MTVPATRLTVLGHLGVEGDGVAGGSGLPGRRAELVFAYLAVEHDRMVSRDELADALWPDLLPDSWAPALRGVVADVRRFLGDAGLDPGTLLERAPGGYRLRLPATAVVDLDEARAALAAARTRLPEGDPQAAATSAARAEELAHLPFLAQHEGVWVEGIRRELELLHADALHVQITALRQAGDLRGAASAAERLVRAQPLDETAHRLRIGVLAEAGDHSGAVQAFGQCRAVLRAELGVEPSAETRAALGRASRTGPPSVAEAEPESSLHGYSVMVVEDHDFQRRTALALLRRVGVGPLYEARDGTEALDLLTAVPPPDVIVCDVDMPGMDGVEFVRCVAERGLACAVVIASGLDRNVLHAVETVCEGYGLQVLGVVAKPLTARRLTELLLGYRPGSAGAAPSPAADLAGAVVRGEVHVDYRPLADLADGEICGAEAVARWRRPDRTVVDVQPLVPASDPDGLAGRLVDRLLGAVCAEQALLDRARLDLALWVRLPDAELAQPALADRLGARLRAAGGDPHRIVFLIGPRAAQAGTPDRLAVLTRLRLKGFGLCLDEVDDHTTADRLRRIPLTAVRLHTGLVRDAVGDPGRVPVLEAALELARGLDLPAVAPGCDSDRAFELLLQVGCGHAQGELVLGTLSGAQLPDAVDGWRPPSTPTDSP